MIPFNVSEAMASGFFISGTRQMTGKTNLAKHLVHTLMQNGISVYVIDFSKAWLRNTPINNVIDIPNGKATINLKDRWSTVFDISKLALAERLACVNSFCEALYKSHVNGYNNPELIVFEEAQTYFPNGCMRSLKKYTPAVDYITVGGNFRTSFGLITQFPSMVDKAPVKAAQQRYFGLSTEYNDKQYVKSFVGKENLTALTNLKLGEFLYQNKGKIIQFQCTKYGSPVIMPESGWFNLKTERTVQEIDLAHF